MTPTNNHINYIEFLSTNIEKTKAFYSTCFGWEFTDYGPNYTSFENSGLQGGFVWTQKEIVNETLVVLFHADLESIMQKIIRSGGEITRDIFEFPGGKRFEFLDPSGNKLAVWSHQ